MHVRLPRDISREFDHLHEGLSSTIVAYFPKHKSIYLSEFAPPHTYRRQRKRELEEIEAPPSTKVLRAV